MERIAHNLVQGSPEWDAFRLEHDGASEAAAMLGLSKKVTRSELLRVKHTGIPREFSEWVQENILDRGHELEELARDIMDEKLGVTFYPATYSYGRMSASCDGMTMDGETAFEHKQWNVELAAAVGRGELPDEHQPQCQQIMLVTGAHRVIFTVSDGTQDNLVYLEILPDEEWQKRIIAGWEQFHRDLETYTPPEVIPAAVAAPIRALPVLDIQITGNVVASNLLQWKDIVTERIEAINTDLQDDQDFADAAEMVTFLADGEKRIGLVKEQAQAQASSIDEVFRAMDEIRETMRAKRLELNNLVEARKKAIREEIVANGRQKLADYVAELNAKLGRPYMPQIVGDFAAAIKGKSKLANLRDAADTLLANKKIEADQSFAKIEKNLTLLRELAGDYKGLFADTAQLVMKDADAVEAIIKSRIADHKAEEERKLEAERARIRQEEEARAAAKLKAEQEETARQQRERDAEASAAAATASATPPPEPDQTATSQPEPKPQPVAAISPIQPATDTGARVKLGDINALLYPIQITADGLLKLGFEAINEKNAKLYRDQDFPAICAAIVRHVQTAAIQPMRKAA